MKHKTHAKEAHRPAEPKVKPEPVFTFESPDFPHHAKNELWYIGIGLLLVVGVILTLRLGDYLLTAVTIAAGLALFRVAHERPESIKISINPRGIIRGSKKILGFHQLKAFWASEANGQVTVYMEPVNLGPIIHFVLPEDQVEDVLTVLAYVLPFHQHRNEPVGDRLARILRI